MKKYLFLILSFYSFFSYGAEDQVKHHTIQISNRSTKHVGVTVDGHKFFLKCTNATCRDCDHSSFSPSVNLAVCEAVKVDATYGSFEQLMKDDYKILPRMSEKTFLTVESALAVISLFSAAGYNSTSFQNILSSAMNRFPKNSLAENKHMITCIKALIDTTAEVGGNPIIVGVGNISNAIMSGKPTSIIWSALSFNQNIQKDIYIKAAMEKLKEQIDLSKEAQKDLKKMIRTKDWVDWLKGTVSIPEDEWDKFTAKHGVEYSMQEFKAEVKNSVQDHLIASPGEAGSSIVKFAKDSAKAGYYSAKYVAKNTANYIAQNPAKACAIAATGSVAAMGVVGVYYVSTCDCSCDISMPIEEVLGDFTTHAVVFDGTLYGIKIYQNRIYHNGK